MVCSKVKEISDSLNRMLTKVLQIYNSDAPDAVKAEAAQIFIDTNHTVLHAFSPQKILDLTREENNKRLTAGVPYQ